MQQVRFGECSLYKMKIAFLGIYGQSTVPALRSFLACPSRLDMIHASMYVYSCKWRGLLGSVHRVEMVSNLNSEQTLIRSWNYHLILSATRVIASQNCLLHSNFPLVPYFFLKNEDGNYQNWVSKLFFFNTQPKHKFYIPPFKVRIKPDKIGE